MKVFFIGLLTCILTIPVFAQENEIDYSAVVETIDSDLRKSIEKLTEVRARIAEEKPALAKEGNEIAATLREERRKADLAKVTREEAEHEFEKAQKDLQSWREERTYIETLFNDFQQTWQSTRSPALIENERDTLVADGLAPRADLINGALKRLMASESVRTFPGQALDSEGVLIDGQFVEAGPVTWFESDSSNTSGLITTSDQFRPRIVENTADSSITDLAAGKSARVLFDPTLGSAVSMVESDDSLASHIKQGGFWIYPILLLAAIALIAAIAKWIQISRIRDVNPGKVQNVVDASNQGEFEKALATAESIKHPASGILTRAVNRLQSDPDVSRDDLEEGLFEKFLEAQPSLQKGLPLIAIASATAPLLGLLGTVTGMIETFRLINLFGTGDAKSLASGISEALVTTEFGLIVAIPALILHALLSRKVAAIKAGMEMTSLAFLNGVSDRTPATTEE